MKYLDEFWWTVKAYLTYIEPNTWKHIGAISFAVFLLFLVLQNLFFREDKRKTIKSQIAFLPLIFECLLIFFITLSGREQGRMRWECIPFESWYLVFKDGNMALLVQILANILLFIPLGFLLPCCFARCRRYRYTILSAAILSLVIELIQGIAQIGLFETDDIIHNTLGACIGAGMYAMIRYIRKSRMKGRTLS